MPKLATRSAGVSGTTHSIGLFCIMPSRSSGRSTAVLGNPESTGLQPGQNLQIAALNSNRARPFKPWADMAKDQTIDKLVDSILLLLNGSPPSRRILVSVSGIPGAGKSTLAQQISEKLNELHGSMSKPSLDRGDGSSEDAIAANVPMDGFHLSRAQLKAMPDPETAIHRRGAAFTFDTDGYCQLVAKLAEPVEAATCEITAPAFDHAVKDPVADSIRIGKGTKVVILEGNYVNLDRKPWKTAARSFDLRLMVAVDREVAKQRLIKRHVASGICSDEESARQRVESTDDLNAEDVLAHQVEGVISVALPEFP